jgi:hypothetical protein
MIPSSQSQRRPGEIARWAAYAGARPPMGSVSGRPRVGKGCIRYSRPDKIDFAVVEKMLAATRDSTGEIC